MKILHLLQSNHFSGAENVACQIIMNLPGEMRGIYVSPEGKIDQILGENGIEHYMMNKFSLWEVRRAIQQIQPDIIHAHDFSASVYAALTGGTIPVISHLHHNNPWLKKINLKTIAYGITYFRYKKILTVSASIMNEFIFGRFFSDKTEIIGNPINIDSIRNKVNNPDIKKEKEIVFLGRLVESKNPIRFLCLMKKIRESLPEIHAIMIGDGELNESVKKEIDRMGLKDCIECTGFLSDPYGRLCTAKIMCMPSEWEGFGLAAVEALTLGIPVVSTDAGGLKDIVNSSCGKICYTDEEFEDELYRLLTDTEYFDAKKKGAIKRVQELNNASDYYNTLIQIYKLII